MILDRRGAVPLYFQIYQHLLEHIRSESLQPGEPIPSESELARRLGVSRMTARQAMKTLCDAGGWERLFLEASWKRRPPSCSLLLRKPNRGVASRARECWLFNR